MAKGRHPTPIRPPTTIPRQAPDMTTLRFHGSAAVLLLPLALFVAVTARLFISEAAFDLTGLAAAGVLTLFSGSLLAKAPSEIG